MAIPEAAARTSESKTASAAAALPNRWRALALISLATLMVAMDTAIVAVALPSAQRGLGISDSARQWVLTAYTLSYGGLLLLGGRLADRLGHRRTLLIGAIGFVCSSAVSGAAVSGPMLFAGRALQGGFGAFLVPSTRSLLVLIFHDPKERARALGIFTAVLIGGAVFGFILSGVITNYLDWRWTLYVNVPVAVVVAVGALRLLLDFPGDPSVRIDLPGVLLGTGGMVALVFGLSQAATAGWDSFEVAGPLIAATGLLAAFVLVEARVGSPLLPLRVLLDRNRAGAFITLGLNSFSNFGMLLILTYELQVVLHASPLATGIALVPWAIAASIGAALVGPRLMNRLPARYLLTPGLLLLAAGLVLLSQLTPDTAYAPLILVAELVLGFGAGLNGTPAIFLALSGTPTIDTGVTSAMSSTSNQIGASIGTAALSTIAASATTSYLASHAAVTATSAIVRGFTTATTVGALVLLAGALLVGFLVNADPRPDRDSVPPKLLERQI
ncbi:MAG: MFS transporter [Candidatus Limnocylindrales bacterium]|jgi:EmrB/QacA subfamily drug resistance transporter